MDLDARPYRCFIEVAATRSFTHAAARLHMSQPALSAQIRELERRLGFALFERTSRRVAVTHQGGLLLPYAKRLVGEVALINRAAREIELNEIRIGAAPHTEFVHERMDLMDRFVARRGDVALTVHNDEHSRLMLRLMRRELDFALVFEPTALGADLGDINLSHDAGDGHVRERMLLAKRSVNLVVPAGHRLSALDTIHAEALSGVEVVVPQRIYGVSLSEAITHRFLDLGAILVRAPEGHSIAIERFAMVRGLIAVGLNWIDTRHFGVGQPLAKRCDVPDLALASGLVLLREVGEMAAPAERFWKEAKEA